ncbi:MAG TPA: DUF3710 domain-containing protein [Pseudonocardia sp.]|nr:DUF3710 domain-containing protein [Pseudonocardia sp.]
MAWSPDPASMEPVRNDRPAGGVAVESRRGAAPPPSGPYDGDAVGEEIEVLAAGTVDFGAIRVPVPDGGAVTVEPPGSAGTHAVHIALPQGRLSISALAAPKSGRLWPELVKEIDTSLREGGARVRSFSGDWGRELHATTGGATSVFVGVDGPRWMVYGIATGPSTASVALDEQLRRMLRGTVVVRGRSPYPVRTVLPLTLPPHLAPVDDAEPEVAEAGGQDVPAVAPGPRPAAPMPAAPMPAAPTPAPPTPAPPMSAAAPTSAPARPPTARPVAAPLGGADSGRAPTEWIPLVPAPAPPRPPAPLSARPPVVPPASPRPAQAPWPARPVARRSLADDVETRPLPVVPPAPAPDRAAVPWFTPTTPTLRDSTRPESAPGGFGALPPAARRDAVSPQMPTVAVPPPAGRRAAAADAEPPPATTVPSGNTSEATSPPAAADRFRSKAAGPAAEGQPRPAERATGRTVGRSRAERRRAGELQGDLPVLNQAPAPGSRAERRLMEESAAGRPTIEPPPGNGPRAAEPPPVPVAEGGRAQPATGRPTADGANAETPAGAEGHAGDPLPAEHRPGREPASALLGPALRSRVERRPGADASTAGIAPDPEPAAAMTPEPESAAAMTPGRKPESAAAMPPEREPGSAITPEPEPTGSDPVVRLAAPARPAGPVEKPAGPDWPYSGPPAPPVPAPPVPAEPEPTGGETARLEWPYTDPTHQRPPDTRSEVQPGPAGEAAPTVEPADRWPYQDRSAASEHTEPPPAPTPPGPTTHQAPADGDADPLRSIGNRRIPRLPDPRPAPDLTDHGERTVDRQPPRRRRAAVSAEAIRSDGPPGRAGRHAAPDATASAPPTEGSPPAAGRHHRPG